MFDLNDVRIKDQHVEFRLKHPVTGVTLDDPEDPVFYVLPTTSEKIRSLEKKLKVEASNTVNTDNREELLDYSEKSIISILKACIVDWKNLQYNGEEFDCNAENKALLLEDPAFTPIKDQLTAFVNKYSNFM